MFWWLHVIFVLTIPTFYDRAPTLIYDKCERQPSVSALLSLLLGDIHN